MLRPTRDEFTALAVDHDMVPVAREVYADLMTPISAFMSLASGARHAFLLESVVGGERLGRYSFLGLGVDTVTEHRVESGSDVFASVSSKLRTESVARVPGLPRFVGGAVGYVGYEAAAAFERVPRHSVDAQRLPDLSFMFTDVVVAFDHVRRVMQIIAPARPGADPSRSYDDAIRRIDKVVATLESRDLSVPLGSVDDVAPVELAAHTTREEFCEAVRTAKEHILAGDIFQVVLSQRFSATYEGDGLDLYRVLRAVNPSPYMFYLRTPEVTLVGSSPEPLVRVEDEDVMTRPLAGTRPRGEGAVEDARLREELLADAKERAEHVMLVDLGRNDLGRVCRPGTIQVSQLMEVENYSHVMHIVSTVDGKLEEGKDAFDALEATFPAGTVSGAPKIRAMEIIRDLEPMARGPYAGTVGYVGYDGAMDMCITIRTLVIADGTVAIQSGAGIVADSDPDREFEETLHKARALHRTVEIAAAMAREVAPA